ncbi:hypothetical protein Tco_0259881 [Tanacetum coccineum]
MSSRITMKLLSCLWIFVHLGGNLMGDVMQISRVSQALGQQRSVDTSERHKCRRVFKYSSMSIAAKDGFKLKVAEGEFADSEIIAKVLAENKSGVYLQGSNKLREIGTTERVVAKTVVVPRRQRKKLSKQTEQDAERGEAHQNWVDEVGRSEARGTLADLGMFTVRGGYEYYGSRGRGVRRGMKRDRVTRDLPTPTQSPRSMSPVANSSIVVDANEEVPDTGDQESFTRKRGARGVNLNKNIPADSS